MDPSGVVRMISILEPLLFEAPSMFMVHLSRRSLCIGALRVNSEMKSAKACPLIDILRSYLMSYGFNFVAYFAIRSVACGFFMMLSRGCSVNMTI